jgi:hypothetical protein
MNTTRAISKEVKAIVRVWRGDYVDNVVADRSGSDESNNNDGWYHYLTTYNKVQYIESVLVSLMGKGTIR